MSTLNIKQLPNIPVSKIINFEEEVEQICGDGRSIQNQNPVITATNPLFHWEGTLEEYIEQDIEHTHPEWVCFINNDDTSESFNNRITNTATVIPQDIKLEFNAGTLTLKEGSKVYVPNGYSGSLTPNANNWALATLSFDSGSYWNSITYDGTKFIVFGNKYNSSLGHSYIITSTSVDGISWSSLTMSFQYNNTYGNWKIACNGTNYIALSSTGYISTSTNGTTWMVPNQDTNLGNNSWSPIIYDGTRYVALSSTGYISTSTDGTTWAVATQNANLGNNSWISLIYDGTKYVALSNTGYISTSTDGTTWAVAIQNANLGNNSWISLIYDGTKYVALDENGYISTSTDGTTWAIPTSLPNLSINSSYWRGVASDGTKFVALSSYQYTAISYPTPDQLIFDETLITHDVLYGIDSGTIDGSYFIFNNGSSLDYYLISRCVSGEEDTIPGTSYHAWYDTINNLIKMYREDGTTIAKTQSLPLAKITIVNQQITSVDQIFNGFGYIGSTVFALPGVMGLMPNYRNSDGTLKNTIVTVPSVNTFTATSFGYGLTYMLNSSGEIRVVNSAAYSEGSKPTWFDLGDLHAMWFDTERNTITRTTDGGTSWIDGQYFVFGRMYMTNAGQLDWFNFTQTFHAVNYNDKEFIAHQSMPGNKYIDLTLGASSTQYTAPADGYYMLRWWSTGDSFVYFSVNKDNTGLLSNLISSLRIDNYSGYGKPIEMYISVSKGQIVRVVYTGLEPTSDTSHPDYKMFRFIFANGSK